MFCKHRINLLIRYQHCINSVTNKHFHLSHLNHVRKQSSSRKTLTPSCEDVQEHAVSGIFHDTSENVDEFTNFYGVEGDEGVINVDELEKPDKSINRLQKMTSHQQPLNEFRSFNFGAIRLDNENKPSFYVNNRKVKSNINASKKLTSEENNNEQANDSNFKNLEASNNLSEDDHVSNYNNRNQHVTHNTPNISKSFIDKYYFAETCSEDIAHLEKEVTDNLTKAQKFRGKIISTSKILPKSSVHNMNKSTVDTFKSNNFQSIETNVSESCVQNECDSSKVSESFIDKEYFADNYTIPQIEKHSDNIIESKNIIKSDNFQSIDANVIKLHQQNKFDSTKVSESFIDKEYFADNYSENSVPKVEECSDNYIENQFFNTIDTSKPDSEIASVSQTNEYYSNESFVPITNNSKFSLVNENSYLESKQSVKENSKNYEKDIKFIHNDNNQDISEISYDSTSSDVSTVGNEINKQQRENLKRKSNQYNASTINTDVTKENKKGFQVFSQNKNPNNVINPESTSNLLKKSQDEEPSNESKVETAFDFVKKLRKNNLLSDDVKKGISAKKEKKVDSKGFRILKHQVPSLQYFTNEEMLELLKGCILYTDEDIVVLNKPYNLVIHESSTSKELACLSRYLDDLAKILDKNTNSPKLFTVHRLDKETTGCLLLARNEVSAARLKSLFAQRKIVKTYWIVTTKVPDPMEGIIDIPISEGKIENRSRMVLHPKLPDETPYVNHSKNGKQAITQYNVIAVSGNAALVEVRPETGIKHQIRVHFGFGLSCPILGDHKYSHLDKLVPQKLQSDLLQRLQVRQSKVRHIPLHIHSKHVLIPQYSNDRNLFVTAPLPHHMSENMQFLKFKKKK